MDTQFGEVTRGFCGIRAETFTWMNIMISELLVQSKDYGPFGMFNIAWGYVCFLVRSLPPWRGSLAASHPAVPLYPFAMGSATKTAYSPTTLAPSNAILLVICSAMMFFS